MKFFKLLFIMFQQIDCVLMPNFIWFLVVVAKVLFRLRHCCRIPSLPPFNRNWNFNFISFYTCSLMTECSMVPGGREAHAVVF